MKNRRSLVALLAVASAVPAFAACIFDSGGDYQGGGRRSETPAAEETTTPVVVVAPTTTTPGSKTDAASGSRDAAADG